MKNIEKEYYETEKINQVEHFKVYAYAEPDNTYTLQMPELKKGCKWKIRKIKDGKYKIEIINKRGLF